MATLTAGRGFNSNYRRQDTQKIAQYATWAAVVLFLLLAGSWIHLWASESRFAGLCTAIEGQAVDGDTKTVKAVASSLQSQFCY